MLVCASFGGGAAVVDRGADVLRASCVEDIDAFERTVLMGVAEDMLSDIGEPLPDASHESSGESVPESVVAVAES